MQQHIIAFALVAVVVRLKELFFMWDKGIEEISGNANYWF
jgi:hypothetical protein